MRWRTLLLVLAMIEPVTRLDHMVRDVAQSARRPEIEGPMHQLTSAGKPAIVISGLLALALFDEAAGILTVRGCIAVLVPVNLAVEALKWSVNRTRPDGERHRRNSSFPSSHAANALALSWMLSRRWPRGAIAFFAAGVLVAISRIYLNRHFLSDVVSGAALGVLVAAAMTRRWPVLDPGRVRAGTPGLPAA